MYALLAVMLATPLALANTASATGGGYSFPELSVGDASAIEGQTDLAFEVTLDEAVHYPVVALVHSYDITAHGRRDYIGGFRWVYFAPGSDSETVTFEVVDDKKQERDELTQLRVFWAFGAKTADGIGDGVIYDDDDQPNRRTELALNILHINDHHSHLNPDDFDFFIKGEEVDLELGGFPRVVAAMNELEAALGKDAHVVKIHAGDAITGTLFYTLFGGEADAALMNEVCFDIFALGNHEFDGGDDGLAFFLDFLNSGVCGTETLAANVIPAIGTPLAPVNQDDYIKPFTVIEYDGVKVGYIGIDIAQKTQVSSSPFDTTEFLDEVETAQWYTDLLTAIGIENIVLVTHQGYQQDQDLASQVAGVDVIVGGDSHTRLGDFSDFGLSTLGEYPTIVQDARGQDVCVVQAWEYTNVVGEVRVEFDNNGRVKSCEGTPHLMLGDVRDFDEDENGISLTQKDVDAFLAGTPFRQWGIDAAAQAVLDDFSAEVAVLEQQVIGSASEDICLARFPNDGRSGLCAVGTLPFGGEIQQLVAIAYQAQAFRADVALQNSGGVRIDIPEGDLTIATIYELLPFANTLVELEMTGAEIALALEQGIGNVLDAGGSTGAFPYGAGIRWDLDTTKPFGERFSNIEIRRKGEADFQDLDLTATYIVVANSFMVSGGDGYQVLADVAASGRAVDTFLDYAQSFIDYIQAQPGQTIGKPTEYSLKSFIS